jgi:hypothetical protein
LSEKNKSLRTKKLQDSESYLPVKTILLILGVWILLAVSYLWLSYISFYPSPPRIFPISQIFSHTSNIFSVIPLILIIGLITIFIYKGTKNLIIVYGVCLAIIVLGNFLQGGIQEGFINTLVGQGNRQPYYDTLKITDGYNFLHQFNSVQYSLTNHSRTHPPFLVLLIYWLRILGGGKTILIGSTLIVSSIFIFFFFALRLLEVTADRAAKFTLLLALIPSINIYSIFTWDALAAAGFMVFLYALISIFKQRIRWSNITLLIIGFTFANMMSFLAIGMVGVLGLVGIWQYYKFKSADLLISLGILIIAFLLVFLLWKFVFNYDQLMAIFTAMRFENSSLAHFNADAKLKNLIFSRFEDLGEIMLFLSIGVLAVLLNMKYRNLRFNLESFESVLFLSGSALILLPLAAGLFYTGETARPFVWFVPFVLVALINIKDRTLIACIILAAMQTILMQLIANYYW